MGQMARPQPPSLPGSAKDVKASLSSVRIHPFILLSSIHLSVHPITHSSVHSITHRPILPSFFPPIISSIHPSHLPPSLLPPSIQSSIHPPMHPSAHHSPTHPLIHPFNHLSIYHLPSVYERLCASPVMDTGTICSLPLSSMDWGRVNHKD